MDKLVFDCLNRVRENPNHMVAHLQKLRKNFVGSSLRFNDIHFIETFEGPKAIKEAIEFLKLQEPVH